MKKAFAFAAVQVAAVLLLAAALLYQHHQVAHLRAENHKLVNGTTAYESWFIFTQPDGSLFILSDPDDQCNDSDTPAAVRNSIYCN